MAKIRGLLRELIDWIDEHQIQASIIALGLIIVSIPFLLLLRGLIGLGLAGYINSKSYEIDYSQLPQPLSTRGLPPPVTDVPVILPPDPGEAGKATLAGIDSNNDGVRDDLEREIVYMYPQNEEVRRVLRAMVKTKLQRMLTSGDHEYYKTLTLQYFAFQHCYWYLVFGDLGQIDNMNVNILMAMLRNTKEREKIDQARYEAALPFTVDDPGNTACIQPLVEGKY